VCNASKQRLILPRLIGTLLAFVKDGLEKTGSNLRPVM
jgi:hypothetical protein